MKALVIVDFNLVRQADVRLMVDYAKERYGLSSVLIRSNPGAVERTLSDIVIDLDPLASDFVERAVKSLSKLGVDPIAVLPFSDNSVASGASLAERLGLGADSGVLAQAAFSKDEYRRAEEKLRALCSAQGMKVPYSARVRSLKELQEFSKQFKAGFVLKPSCEGNNRGVIKLQGTDHLEAAWEEVEKYEKEGLICEEWIDLPNECSFDGLAHLTFITEKTSRMDRYPVEKGQIVPAKLHSSVRNSIESAGRVANLIVGQRIGPFHNEVKFDPSTLETAIIEPNRRPAGMKIWHLAEKVFGVNLFKLWIDRLVTGSLPEVLPLPKGTAGIRLLPAAKDGVFNLPGNSGDLLNLILERIRDDIPEGIEWFDFQVTCKNGSIVSSVQRDNGDFIAQISAYAQDDKADLRQALDRFESAWVELTENYTENYVEASCLLEAI